MKKLSDGTEWLLEFANLGRKKGVLTPPTKSALEKLKRKPEFNDRKLLPRKYPDLPIDVDSDGLKWDTLREPKLIDRKVEFPLDTFKKWVLREGIPPVKGIKKVRIGEIKPFPQGTIPMSLYNWYDLQLGKKTKEDEKIKEVLRKDQYIIRVTLDWIVNGAIPPEPLGQLGVSPTDLLAPRVYWVKDKAVFDHPATLPIAAIAYLLDFWVNQKELHPLLRECPTCGRFFFRKEKKPGRPQEYCCKECKILFLQRSREEDRKRKQTERDELRELIRQEEEARKAPTLKRKKEDKQYRKYLNERQERKAFTPKEEEARIEQYLRKEKSYDDVLIRRIISAYSGYSLERILIKLDGLKKEKKHLPKKVYS